MHRFNLLIIKKMNEKILNEKESLELISQMILRTKDKFEGGSSKPFLVFGYTTFILSFIIYFLILKTGNYYFHLLWFLIPVVGYSGMKISSKKLKSTSTNQIDRIIKTIWFVNAITCVLISISAFFVNIPVLSLMVMLMGICTTITGIIINSKLITISGSFGILSSAALFLISGNEKILVFGFIFLFMMIIPGHLLTKIKRNV